jgi:hypothetical protein
MRNDGEPHSDVFAMPRPANRTVTTTFRTQPAIRDALQTAAGLENRSLSNLIERLAIDYCRRKGIPIAGLDDPDAIAQPGHAAVHDR